MPEYLLQFGFMGSIYAKYVLGKPKPKVGLLNIGAEDTKGTPLQLEAYRLLQEADAQGLLHFAGNVEARDVPLGVVDVVVADGFSGNILLKSIEGTAMYMASMMKGMFTRNLWSKLGYLLCKPGVRAMRGRLDYNEAGGTMLLGIAKPVIKAHGSSKARAIRSAIAQAKQVVEQGVAEKISENIAAMQLPKEQ